ncbi:hypothetical protein CRT60_29465 [Azospirillum palustre]|uniref:Uncharacterized protein n=1 Tax=Azospirillum palustre TaxID=2044885 RepID=A0A2B8AYB1_9PROT|nr:hypothetical protein [Azospirillum palustre]PGH53964.1 hypothetical protein CRT60_29465 [Azospirillum palustre]
MPSLFPVPTARRIDRQRLLSVALIPFAAAIAMASTVAATGFTASPLGEANSTLGFLLDFVKFCYLAVAMAHLSGAIADHTCGSLAAGLSMDEYDAPEPVSKDEFWRAFPNHVDGAAIAGAVTMLSVIAGSLVG